jgi:hypothetical protein
MVEFAIVPTPKGEYRVAAGRITWFRDEDPEDAAAARSLIWLDDGSQATVLMAAADLQQLLHTVSEPAPALVTSP